MKKRVLSLALAISLCLTLFPTGALAETFPQEVSASAAQETATPETAAKDTHADEETTPDDVAGDDAGDTTPTPTPPPQDAEQAEPATQSAANRIAVFAGETYVAEVETGNGTKQCTDINEAFKTAVNSAGVNNTVKLLTDVELNDAKNQGIIVPDDSITLDLNGKTLSQRDGLTNALMGLDSSVLYVQSGCTLTIKDSDSAGKGKIVQPNTCPAVAVNGGKVIIQGGTFETTAGTYNDGLTTNDKNCAVYVAGGTAEISGGTFTGGPGCKGSLAVEGGSTVKLSGGTYKAADDNAPSVYYANGSVAGLLESNYRFVDGNGKTVADNVNSITGTVTVKEKGVAYIDEKGKEQSCEEYKTVTADLNGDWTSGWYVVKDSIDIEDGFYFYVAANEAVNLILCDGAEVTGEFIGIYNGGTLNIYGQQAGTGKITLLSTNGTPAISVASKEDDPAALNVYGGNITATATECNGVTSAAIGLSEGIEDAPLYVNISGGTVTAQAPMGAQAIGVGKYSSNAGKVTVTIANGMKCVKTDDLSTHCDYNNTDGTSVTITKCNQHVWTYTKTDEDTHTKTCQLCNTTESTENHTYKNWTDTKDGNHTGTCDCGATQTEAHTTKSTPNTDGLTHTAKCTKCDYQGASEVHTYDKEQYNDGYYYKQCACGAFLAAEYDGQQYALLQAAIDAAKNGGTVELLQDVGESVTVTDGTVTIDLNNMRWSYGQSGTPLTVNGGSVTLQNGKVQSGVDVYAANGIVLNGGSLTLAGDMVVIGGRKDNTTSLHAIQVNGGDLTLNENVVLANGLQVPAGKTLGDYLPEGLAFMKCYYNGTTAASPNFVPGVYTSNAYTGDMQVKPHQHAAEGENGTCACGLQYAAKITRDSADTFYATLPEAITALADGDTLTLLDNVDADNGVTINKSVTFDLNGHKLYSSVPWNNVLTVNNGTVTVKSGTIEATSYGTRAIYAMGFNTNLTLEKVTIQIVGSVDGAVTAVNGVTVAIKSGDYQGLYLYPDARVTLEGGTFRLNDGHSIFWQANSFGGNLSKDCMDLLADGNGYLDESNQLVHTSGSIDVVVTVVSDTTTRTPVAKIGETEYPSLQKALSAVQSGETITLMDDLDLGNGAVLLQEKNGKNFTIDLNGHTLRGNGDYLVFIFEYGGHVTLKNGTLDGRNCTSTDGVVRVSSKNNPTLTLENVNAVSSKNNVPLVGALGGTVEFDSGTYTGGVLIEDGGNVVLKRGTFVNGANSYSIKTEISGKTLNDYLDEGSAFWEGDTITAVGGVSSADTLYVKPTPIRSVTAEKAEVTTEFGLTGSITLQANIQQPVDGGTTYQWYKVEGSSVTAIDGATAATYQLPADLTPATYHYRLTATKDGYSKSCDFTVTVKPADITNAVITFPYEWYGGTAPVFDPYPGATVKLAGAGPDQEDSSKVNTDYKVMLNGKVLTEGTDYTIVGDTNKADRAGTHTLQVAGTGNYTGTASGEWEVQPCVLTDMSWPQFIKTYDGKPVTLESSALNEATRRFNYFDFAGWGSLDLKKDVDFTITDVSTTFTSVDAESKGDVTFTVTLKNSNYTFKDAAGNNTKSKTFTWKDMSIGKSYLGSLGNGNEYLPATGSLRVANGAAGTYIYDFSQLLKTLPEGLSYGDIEYWLYDRSYEQGPHVDLTPGYYTDGVTLDEKTGILTLPINAVNTTALSDIGTVKIVVRTQNYGGYYVTINVSTANLITVSGITAQGKTYDGTTDVTLDCSNAKFDGVFGNDKLTVTAKGKFASADAGEQKVVISDLTLGGADADKYILVQNGQQTETTATIAPKSIEGAAVVLGEGLVANGKAQTQTVAKVLLDGKELPADAYTVTGNTATDPGSYTLTITAKGNYTGIVTVDYVVAPAKPKPTPGGKNDSASGSGTSGGASAGSSESKNERKQEGTAQSTPQAGSNAEPSAMTVVPKTADASNPMLYVVLWAAALAGFAATAFAAFANKRSGRR